MGKAQSAASRGSIGGAADDGGVEYRRGVAAYAVAYGLAGAPLLGFEIPTADAYVDSVALETDAAVDDIRITFTSGWVADVQAKRTLRKGQIFEKAVAQWGEAGLAGMDLRYHRLVIASGDLSGPMRGLQRVLNRRRLHSPGGSTKVEAEMLNYLEKLLSSLTAEQCERVLDAAIIWEVTVEEPEHSGAREAVALLRGAGVPVAEGEAGIAWEKLCTTAGRLARRRGGYNLAGWLNELRAVGLMVEETRDNPAGRLELRRTALERYAERMVREARELDLRALGAELPPLILEEADAGVQVGIDPNDSRKHADLLWAFLRRHRVVLTGLPGAGKSTAVRQAAGQLAQRLLEEVRGKQPGDAGYPFPVLASLKQINALDDGRSFGDRMIAIAVRDDSVADRDLLGHEILIRLDKGLPIALFLDALDETYDDRATVVTQVHSFLAGLPESSCVLIATRDIAYGQAATLGWADLRLLAPDKVGTIITAVLEVAVTHKDISTSARSTWVETRRNWVDRVLAQDQALKETPLIPTLLALLAVERTPDRLPTRRAEVLKAVVTDMMKRHEAPRHGKRPLQNLTGNSIGTAAMHAYAAEATAILDSEGVTTIDQVTAAVAATLAELWGLAPGPAQAAALDAVRFLDETGVFVMSEPDDTVTARLSLFAEIGDAIHTIQHPDLAAAWASRRIDGRQLEPIVLAAGLNAMVSQVWQNELSTRPGDLELARAMVRAHQEGVRFTDDTKDRLRSQLLASIERGNQNGWSDWHRLVTLEVPVRLGERAIEAAAQHGITHRLFAKADLYLQFIRSDAGEPDSANDRLLLELLSVHNLPMSAHETGTPRGFDLVAIDGTLADTQLLAATEVLRRNVPGAVDLIRSLALNSSRGLSDSLETLLRAHGHQSVAKQITEERLKGLRPNKLLDLLNDNRDLDRYPHFLSLVGEAEPVELATRQRVELRELGDFLETLDMNDMGVTQLYSQGDDFLRELIELTCVLFEFERGTVAAQAHVVLDRLETDDSLETYFSLFDTAEARSETHWSAVSDPDAAVDLLVGMFYMTLSQARFAARCLWGSQVAAAQAEPILRDLVPGLDNYPRHQRVAASTLASFRTAPEPATWLNSPNPVLRRVTAQMTDPVSEGRITNQFQALLTDEDGYVRETAIKKLTKTDIPELETVLEQLTTQEQPGWKCQSCSTQNPPGNRSCTKDDCYLVGPDPAAKANKLLEEMRRERGT